jgi:N-formylglutamate deformylase
MDPGDAHWHRTFLGVGLRTGAQPRDLLCSVWRPPSRSGYGPVSTLDRIGATASPPRAVVHIPHSSTIIPGDVRGTLVLGDSALELELLRLTDRYTDQLFDPDPAIAIPVVFGVSRVVVDPERFADDALEPMAARDMGAVYMSTSSGAPLRAGLTASQRAELLARFYYPHHAALDAAITAVLDTTGACLILDAHSFPSDPLPCDLDQERTRPEICIGTDPFHTSDHLAADTAAGFAAHGLDVAVDRPYTGALVPARWYRRERRVRAVMVEINRRLYMDELSGEKTGQFSELKAVVQSVLTVLIEGHAEATDPRRPGARAR